MSLTLPHSWTKLARATAILALALTATAISRANLTGVVVENAPDAGNAADIPNYTNLPWANFSSPSIDYESWIGGYTVSGFLNNPTFSNEHNAFDPNASADNVFIQLTGSIYLNAGLNVFSVEHDDGVVIKVTGIGTVVDQPGPTGPVLTPFDVTAPSAGNYNVEVDYAECCGPPAALVWEVNQQVVAVGAPDTASTLLLLGLGLGALALGARRLRAVAA